MSVSEWAAFAGLVIAAVSSFYAMTRFIVRSIMTELAPNGGNSIKDQVSRIEQRLDQLMLELTKKQ